MNLIEMLTNSNIKPFLRRAFDPLPAGSGSLEDDSRLTAVEVYKVFELTNGDHGRDLQTFALSNRGTSAHGIGVPWKEGDGNTYALEFTPWNELAHLKLTIRPKAWFSRLVWKKGERRKLISNGGDEAWNFSDLHLDSKKTSREEIACELSVGEFFEGFTNELCFFGSPKERGVKAADLRERAKNVKERIAREGHPKRRRR